jgi:hypothetical protein
MESPPPKNCNTQVESSWNVMAHGDAQEGKQRGNWRMEWVASTLHTTSEHGVSSITTTDAHISVASSRLNWRFRRFTWTRPFCQKAKFGFCAYAITFQMQSNNIVGIVCGIFGHYSWSPLKWNNVVWCNVKQGLLVYNFHSFLKYLLFFTEVCGKEKLNSEIKAI